MPVPAAPEVPELLVPEAPELPELLVPDMPLLPPSMVLPLLPLLPLLSPVPCIELQAVSPKASASRPASSTLWCLCFMINSF